MTGNLPDYKPNAMRLCKEWGWHSPPQNIIDLAEKTHSVIERPFREAIVAMGLMKQEDVYRITSDIEGEEAIRDALVGENDALYSEMTRISAMQEGLQYLETLDDSHIDIDPCMEDKQVQAECRAYGFVVIQVQQDKTILVFSDYEDSLTRYRQLSGVDLIKSAVRGYISSPIYAVAQRDVVLRYLREKTGSSQERAEESHNVIYDERLREEGGGLRKLANLHDLAISHQSTDIHIDVDPITGRVECMYRVFGDMREMSETLSPREYQEIKNYLLKNSGAMIKFERMSRPLDGSYEYQSRAGKAHNVRCSYMPYGHGRGQSEPVSIRLRLLAAETKKVDMEKLHLHPRVMQQIDGAVRPSQGLILLVGPTGSGKSTTIAAMLGRHRDIYGDRRARLSLEDPIERLVPGVRQIQIPYSFRHSEEDGFAVYFRNFLRHDPDLIWLGEIRDEKTAEAAVHAATTGHMVLSTLHAETPVKAIERLSNMMPTARQDMRTAMIQALTLIVGQRLIKKLCTDCSTWGPPNKEEIDGFEYLKSTRALSFELPEAVKHENKEGCPSCRHGYVGRLPVNETMVVGEQAKDTLIYGTAEEKRDIQKFVGVHFEEAVMEHVIAGRANVEALMF